MLSSYGLSKVDQRVSTALDSYCPFEILFLISTQIQHIEKPNEAH